HPAADHRTPPGAGARRRARPRRTGARDGRGGGFAVISFIKRRFDAWWQARHAPTDTWTLTQSNIYIVPTRVGFAFAATLMVLLVASINYQLNLGFLLTFMLAGSGLVSMQLTHRTLRGLTLHLRPPEPAFAGEAALLEIVLTGSRSTRDGIVLRARIDAHGKQARWTW